jgi:peptidoglycan-N-acetylglucosamine deacetylase
MPSLTRRNWWVILGTTALVLVIAAVVLVVAVRSGGGGDARDEQAAGSSAPSSAPSSTSVTVTEPSSSSTAPSPSSTAPSAPGTTRPPRPAPGVPASLRGEDVTVLPTSRRVVALTFDAGANSAGLRSILATLADQQVHATVFLTGRWVEDNPSGVSSVRAGGHRVGNHSTTHPHFPALSDQAIATEVRGAEQRIQAAGADPRPLFRFPFGDRDARTIAAVNDLGYIAVRWTVDTLGWKGTSGGITAQQVSDRVAAALRPGAIVLMHIGSNPDDGSTLDADALPGMITRLQGAGYDFVTIDEMLAP